VRGKVVRGCPGLKRVSRSLSSAGTHPVGPIHTRGEVARRSQARRNGGVGGRAARQAREKREAGRRPPPSVLTTARRPRNEMRRPPPEPQRYTYTSLGAASRALDGPRVCGERVASAGSSRSRRQLPGLEPVLVPVGAATVAVAGSHKRRQLPPPPDVHPKAMTTTTLEIPGEARFRGPRTRVAWDLSRPLAQMERRVDVRLPLGPFGPLSVPVGSTRSSEERERERERGANPRSIDPMVPRRTTRRRTSTLRAPEADRRAAERGV
jgi:hypothetical protein